MTPATLNALNGSIRKWAAIVRSTRAKDKGKDNCPLCDVFLADDCLGCPVAIRTRKMGCDGSPYIQWCDHQEDNHPNREENQRAPRCRPCLFFAKQELAFLQSLLPRTPKK